MSTYAQMYRFAGSGELERHHCYCGRPATHFIYIGVVALPGFGTARERQYFCKEHYLDRMEDLGQQEMRLSRHLREIASIIDDMCAKKTDQIKALWEERSSRTQGSFIDGVKFGVKATRTIFSR